MTPEISKVKHREPKSLRFLRQNALDQVHLSVHCVQSFQGTAWHNSATAKKPALSKAWSTRMQQIEEPPDNCSTAQDHFLDHILAFFAPDRCIFESIASHPKSSGQKLGRFKALWFDQQNSSRLGRWSKHVQTAMLCYQMKNQLPPAERADESRHLQRYGSVAPGDELGQTSVNMCRMTFLISNGWWQTHWYQKSCHIRLWELPSVREKA